MEDVKNRQKPKPLEDKYRGLKENDTVIAILRDKNGKETVRKL